MLGLKVGMMFGIAENKDCNVVLDRRSDEQNFVYLAFQWSPEHDDFG